jgi:hypothetical protein
MLARRPPYPGAADYATPRLLRLPLKDAVKIDALKRDFSSSVKKAKRVLDIPLCARLALCP